MYSKSLDHLIICVAQTDRQTGKQADKQTETGRQTDRPLSRASASMTASTGGGSTAFIINWPIGPSLSSLIDRHSSCSGVRNISGVVCCSSLQRTPSITFSRFITQTRSRWQASRECLHPDACTHRHTYAQTDREPKNINKTGGGGLNKIREM